MIKTRVARRYARALFGLAEESGQIEPVARGIEAATALLTADPAVWGAMIGPAVSREAKAQALDAVVEKAGLTETVANFLRVLLDARKIAVLPLVAGAYREMADEATGRVRGVALAPMALGDAELKSLAAALSKAVKKDVILEAAVDPSLVGGVVARVGNLVFDASVKTQLERMKDTLIKG